MTETNWKHVVIDKNSVKKVTEKGGALVEMPKNSGYAGWKFWHPNKLIKDYNGVTELSFTDSFEFNLFKQEKDSEGMYVKVDEAKLTAKEFQREFE